MTAQQTKTAKLTLLIFPFIQWITTIRPASLKKDIIAGITVALILIPQSMAYAQLAGLPTYFGLYAAFLPPMVAALFGSSRQLSTGPVAVVSLLTALALEPVAAQGSPGYIAYAVLLAALVGFIQFILGLFRLGALVNFLSHPVVNGFTNAAAIIIASSQLDKLFGVHVDSGSYHFETVLEVMVAAADHTHWPALLMGLTAMVVVYAVKAVAPICPGLLVAVLVTTLISWLTGYERRMEVSLETLQAPSARALIERYNHAARSMEQMTRDRNRYRQAQAEWKAQKSVEEALLAQHKAEILDLRIRQADQIILTLRENLRRLSFERAIDKDDHASGFFLKGHLPDGIQGDRRTWRIITGRQPLNPNALQMSSGGEVVGTIPRGLPGVSLPLFDPKAVSHLLFYAIVIAWLGFMEAISVARAVAAKTGQRIDPNQELIGQGLANIIGSVTGSYPVSGSFSRTAVNLKTGASSGLAGVVASLVVLVVLLYLTPVLYHLPQSVLAVIIIMAVAGLINVHGFIHAWRAQWFDGAISILTFFATLAFAPHLDRGLLIGAGLSLGVFLYKSMRPTVVDLSLGVDRSLHDAVSHGLDQCQFIDVVRFDGPLFFANAGYLEDQIRERRNQKKSLKHIIIVANGINDIDASGQEALSLVVDRARSAGLDISISGANEAVMAGLGRTHLNVKIGDDHFYPDIGAAINAIHEITHQGENERSCPLKTVVLAHTEKQKES